MIVTFFLVMIGWVFFRAENYYLAYFKVLFNIGNIDLIDAQSRINFHDNIVILIFSFILATPLFKNLVKRLYKKLNKDLIDLIDTMFYIFILLMSTIYLVNSTYNPFIYFRF